ncbi:MAG: hypothetical protein JWO36_306 [Myxococcales bacterium]|nr:hypothetical protein [Myxococcales bacterium]
MQRIVFVFILLLALGRGAHAGGIVLESYTGERPADASRLMSPILDELATRGFSAGDTVARRYETQVSRAGLTPSGISSDFAAQADRGLRAWVAGKFDEAIKILAPLVDAAHSNTAAFAKDPSLRDPLLKALISLALSYQRSGDNAAARATFGEVLRGFPDTQIARGTYGPEAAELFEQVRRETLASGNGKLTIKVSDETALVFIDERFLGAGSKTIQLVPGEYRVCVTLNNQPSRSHRIVIRPNAEATLAVDAKHDQALRTLGWTGFSFAVQADRDTREPSYAAQFANLLGANAVAVIGIDQSKGRPAIVGSLVSLSTGREIRRATIAMDPDPSTERLKALARFLAGEDPAAGLEVQMGAAAAGRVTQPAAEHEVDDTPTSSSRWGGYKWIAGGAGVAALGTGITLLALDGRCSMTPTAGRPCNDLYSSAGPGFITLGIGAALAGVSVYLFVTEHKAPARTAYVVPTGDGAFAGFATTW